MLAAAANSKTLWYSTRATGMVSLVLLTVSVALGIAEIVRFATPRWPRFVIAALHRNSSLLAVAFLAVHIVTAVADSFAPIRLIDAFVPFVGAYRPLWLGLGTVAFDLLLALVITSLMRERIGYGAWRAVHWAAYVAWPVALLHGLGTGSDTRARWGLIVNVTCLIAVLAAVLTRVGWTRTVAGGRRTLAAFGSVAVAIAVSAWMLLEPMRPGWARKAGTPTALIAASPGSGGMGAATAASMPIPFTSETQGLIRQTSTGSGAEVVTIDARLTAVPRARLRVRIEGTPLPGGGVNMERGTVSLGVLTAPDLYRGGIVSLDGSSVQASLRGPGGAAAELTMDFIVNGTTGVVGGRVTARPGVG